MNRRKFIECATATALGASVAAQESAAQTDIQPDVKKAAQPVKATQTVKTRGRTKTAKRKVLTDRAPKPAGPYSQAIVAGNTVYVAGQVAFSPRTGQVVEGGFEEQAVQVFENVKAILEGAGSSLDNVVRVNVYLTDLTNFSKMNEIYRRYFTESYPARTTVGVQLNADYMIEVDCIALV
ncbi:MAG TPA: Rid family detoxifying hydrolase [Blastocatellia bacterium]|nr:Rid family detoxifying hydrolase [Blastocatellia bacterium]